MLNHSRKIIDLAVDIAIRRHYSFHPQQWGFNHKVGADLALAHVDDTLRKGAKYAAFLDVKAAYPSAPRDLLLLQSRSRLPPSLPAMAGLLLAPNPFSSSENPHTPLFNDTVGVVQGCPASLTVFNIHMDSLLEDVVSLCLPTPNSACIYADDVSLLASNEESLQALLDTASHWAAPTVFSWSIQ